MKIESSRQIDNFKRVPQQQDESVLHNNNYVFYNVKQRNNSKVRINKLASFIILTITADRIITRNRSMLYRFLSYFIILYYTILY